MKKKIIIKLKLSKITHPSIKKKKLFIKRSQFKKRKYILKSKMKLKRNRKRFLNQ
jgi:hypothetical protein